MKKLSEEQLWIVFEQQQVAYSLLADAIAAGVAIESRVRAGAKVQGKRFSVKDGRVVLREDVETEQRVLSALDADWMARQGHVV